MYLPYLEFRGQSGEVTVSMAHLQNSIIMMGGTKIKV